MPSKKTNPWIKFLQSYTKKQQKTNKNYTYKNAIGDKKAKMMYKKMKGGFIDGEVDDDETDGDIVEGQAAAEGEEAKGSVMNGTGQVVDKNANEETVQEGGRKSRCKKEKMSKKGTRRTSKK